MKATVNYTFNAPITTVDDLKATLVKHSTFYHRTLRNADGTPMRFRVSGQLKTWKRDATRFRLPIKHGLNDHYAIESIEFLAQFATEYSTS